MTFVEDRPHRRDQHRDDRAVRRSDGHGHKGLALRVLAVALARIPRVLIVLMLATLITSLGAVPASASIATEGGGLDACAQVPANSPSAVDRNPQAPVTELPLQRGPDAVQLPPGYGTYGDNWTITSDSTVTYTDGD